MRLSVLTVGGQTLDHFDGGVEPKLGQAPVVFLRRNTLHLHRVRLRQSTQTQTRHALNVNQHRRKRTSTCFSWTDNLVFAGPWQENTDMTCESWCSYTHVNTSRRKRSTRLFIEDTFKKRDTCPSWKTELNTTHNIEMSSHAHRRQQLVTLSRGDLNAVCSPRPADMNCVKARPRCTLGVVVFTLLEANAPSLKYHTY